MSFDFMDLPELPDKEFDLLGDIASRAKRINGNIDKLTVEMDLRCVHQNDVKLDLDGLRYAKDGDLMHDVLGINQHLDRNEGKLKDCFVPRYAKPEVAAS